MLFDMGKEEGKSEGRSEGINEGIDQVNRLHQRLVDEKKYEDLERSTQKSQMYFRKCILSKYFG